MGRPLHLWVHAREPVVNTQKLGDTEDPLEENLRVITMCVVQRHPRRIVTLTKTYPHGLKMNRAYGAAALVRVTNPDYECKSGAAPERISKGTYPRGVLRSTLTVLFFVCACKRQLTMLCGTCHPR